jgi:uncharacterized protein YgiM (DUF1202 family)
MRKIFSLLAPLCLAVSAQAQGAATVAETTSLYDMQSRRGTQALYAGTRLDVNRCVHHEGRPYYVARIAATGAHGLVPPEHVRWSSGRTVGCPAPAHSPAVVRRRTETPTALYAGPGLTFDVVGTLRAGEAVRVHCVAGWCAVFDGVPARPAERRGYLPERALRADTGR